MIIFILTILAGISVFSTVSFFMIRKSYRDFCRREDQKERIEILKREINSSKEYLRKNYSTPMDRSIPDNIIPKTEFIIKLIERRTVDDQEKYLKLLLDLLTETFIRLKTDFNDVSLITSPLNTLRDRLVQEHLQFIKDHMPDEF